jgi:hypothetical protein
VDLGRAVRARADCAGGPEQVLVHGQVYEDFDAGANSILIQQAMRFTLLIGNYSREGFNHPGPAYMYVQAAVIARSPTGP